jgi:hypothetical protein
VLAFRSARHLVVQQATEIAAADAQAFVVQVDVNQIIVSRKRASDLRCRRTKAGQTECCLIVVVPGGSSGRRGRPRPDTVGCPMSPGRAIPASCLALSVGSGSPAVFRGLAEDKQGRRPDEE